MQDLLRRVPPNVKGLRVDISMRWMDVSGIHITAKSRLNTQFRFYKEEVLREAECRRNFDPMPDYGDSPSPGIMEAQRLKHQKYAPMVHTAVTQHSRNLRTSSPPFWAGIVSEACSGSNPSLRLGPFAT